MSILNIQRSIVHGKSTHVRLAFLSQRNGNSDEIILKVKKRKHEQQRIRGILVGMDRNATPAVSKNVPTFCLSQIRDVVNGVKNDDDGEDDSTEEYQDGPATQIFI